MTLDETEVTDLASYRKWLEDAAKHCTCCPQCSNHPCDGVLQGGLCDGMECRCNDDYDYDDESYGHYTDRWEDYE